MIVPYFSSVIQDIQRLICGRPNAVAKSKISRGRRDDLIRSVGQETKRQRGMEIHRRKWDRSGPVDYGRIEGSGNCTTIAHHETMELSLNGEPQSRDPYTEWISRTHITPLCFLLGQYTIRHRDCQRAVQELNNWNLMEMACA